MNCVSCKQPMTTPKCGNPSCPASPNYTKREH